MNFKKIGVVVADRDEYKPFADAVRKIAGDADALKTPFSSAIRFTLGKSEVTSVLCGIGKVNAASAAMYLTGIGCDLILNFGLSGGINNVRRGEFILPEKFLEHDFDLTPLGFAPCEKPGQDYVYFADKDILNMFSSLCGARITGTAVCGDRFISSDEDKRMLIKSFNAESCDMETAAVASVCRITGTPFVSLRRISDGADDLATDAYRDMNVNEGAALGDVFIKCLRGVANG